MKKDKKTKGNKPRKPRPSEWAAWFREWWIEIKYSKLYYGTVLLIILLAFLSLYFQYSYEKAQRTNRNQDSEVNLTKAGRLL